MIAHEQSTPHSRRSKGNTACVVDGCGYDRAYSSADNVSYVACAGARQRDACLSLRLAAGNVDRYADADGNCHCHADCCANAHTDCHGDTLADPNAGFVERGAANLAAPGCTQRSSYQQYRRASLACCRPYPCARRRSDNGSAEVKVFPAGRAPHDLIQPCSARYNVRYAFDLARCLAPR